MLRLLQCPSLVWRLAEDLLDIVPIGLATQIEVVAGLGTAGVLFAHTMAGLLDSRRPLTAPPCRFAAFDRGTTGPRVTPAFASDLQQSGVLIADAWGKPCVLAACAGAARKTGAHVVAAAVVGMSTAPAYRPDFPVITLCPCASSQNARFAEAGRPPGALEKSLIVM